MSAGFLVAATGSWELPLVAIAAMLLIATLVFYFLVVPEPIELGEPLAEAAPQQA
jgi:hypothetical protein